MKNASEAEKVLFEGLRKYPVIANKQFKLDQANGRRRDDEKSIRA